MKSIRILVANDDRDMVATMMVLLREAGNEVFGVYDGNHVMGVVLDADPDVVILDAELPGLSGSEVARAIRQFRGSERPLLIGLSSEHTASGERQAFNHYLAKPYDFRELLKLLAPLALH